MGIILKFYLLKRTTLEIEMKTALIFLPVCALIAGVSGSQDKLVLRRVYSKLYEWNGDLIFNKRMEELAQSHDCIRKHADHIGSWQDKEILNKYRNIEYNIACIGGCPPNSSNWSREKPVDIWYEFRHKTGHYDTVLNNNRVGCSAVKSGDDYCVFCYFANGPSPSYPPLRTTTCDRWADWTPSGTTEYEECFKNHVWDPED